MDIGYFRITFQVLQSASIEIILFSKQHFAVVFAYTVQVNEACKSKQSPCPHAQAVERLCAAHSVGTGNASPSGWVLRTFAMALSPCLEKSLSGAQITASLSRLREPRSGPAGLPNRRALFFSLALRSAELMIVSQHRGVTKVCLRRTLDARLRAEARICRAESP